ncbi:MAG: hypothetical protein ACFFBD_00670 [Candidatus Hodarchaeota archaeon]
MAKNHIDIAKEAEKWASENKEFHKLVFIEVVLKSLKGKEEIACAKVVFPRMIEELCKQEGLKFEEKETKDLVEIRVGELRLGGSYPVYPVNTTIKEVLENESKEIRHTIRLWKDWRRYEPGKRASLESQYPDQALILMNYPEEYS